MTVQVALHIKQKIFKDVCSAFEKIHRLFLISYETRATAPVDVSTCVFLQSLSEVTQHPLKPLAIDPFSPKHTGRAEGS